MKAFSVGLFGFVLAGFALGCGGGGAPEEPTQEEVQQNEAAMQEDMQSMQLPQTPGAPTN